MTFTFKTGSVLNHVVSWDHVVGLCSLSTQSQWKTTNLIQALSMVCFQFTSTIMCYN